MNKKNLVFVYSVISLLPLILLVNCFGGSPLMRMSETQNIGNLLSDILPGKFGKIWVERTIQLKTTFEDSKDAPGIMGGPGGRFPLTAYATFMDSSLIECGLKEFEKLSHMNTEEITEYEKEYKRFYNTDRYYFVWLELQTPYAEEVLDIDRWVIFWEDEKGNKYDPQEIIEYPITREKKLFNNSVNPNRDSSGSKLEWNISSKVILLYFSPKNIYGKNVIDTNATTITLTIFNWGNKNIKSKGTWDLKFLNLK